MDLLVINVRLVNRSNKTLHVSDWEFGGSVQYTLDQPDEATQIMTRLYGDDLGASVIDGQIRQLLPLINKDPALGKSEQEPWNHSLDILLDGGVIDKKLSIDQYFTNEFVAG